MANSQSTFTLQQEIDQIQAFGDIEALTDASGYNLFPALTAANDVMVEMMAQSSPWKWSQFQLPLFYSNSWQQDYAIPGLTTLDWLMEGIVIDINNSSTPKPWGYVEVNRYQPKVTASMLSNSFFNYPIFFANWLPNNQLYFGTWGAANVGNATLGNNPVSGSVYQNPIGAASQPANPITQIQDANGNLLVLTGYGTEGTTAPVAPANSAAGVIATPGSGASTIWTVVDPNGQGIRVNPAPSGTGVTWQFNLVGQLKPVMFTNLQQTLSPIPDTFEPHFRAMFIAQLYRYSPAAKTQAKFAPAWQIAKENLALARSKIDRERDAIGFSLRKSIAGSGTPGSWWPGASFPFPPVGR